MLLRDIYELYGEFVELKFEVKELKECRREAVKNNNDALYEKSCSQLDENQKKMLEICDKIVTIYEAEKNKFDKRDIQEIVQFVKNAEEYIAEYANRKE